MESIDTHTPSGRMFIKIIGIFAEFERENLIERISVALEKKVREGYTISGYKIPYGYSREKGSRELTISIEESKIVKEIFTMYVEKNIPMNRIAKMLNERKIPTKLKSTWEANTIRCILVNPTYIGKVRYSMEDEQRYFVADGQHEPIISEELFELAQAKIKNTSRVISTKRPREESYFCGLLTCGVCGSKHTTHNYGRKAYNGEQQYNSAYRCQKKKSCSEDVVCRSPDICHEKVELAFCEYIQNISDISGNNDTEIKATAKKAEQTEQDLLKAIVSVEKKISDLQSRKNQFMEQYVQGDLDFDEYRAIVKKFNEKFDVLENELNLKKAELATATAIPAILTEDIITNIRENWEHLSNNERMMFLHRFIKKINITVEKVRRNSNKVCIDSIEFHTGE